MAPFREVRMSNPVSRLLQRRSLRTGVRRALESGVGLYHTTWRIEAGREAEVSGQLAAELVAWCRDVLSRMHRPYGLDNVTLAVAALGEDDRQVASTNYGLLSPVDFYGSGPVEAQTQATLRRWADDQVFARNGGRLSAVLFSWGDLTRELLLAG